jgi:hypothetical protein
MDKFLPFLYEKAKKDKFEQKFLYVDYPIKENNKDDYENEQSSVEIIEIL